MTRKRHVTHRMLNKLSPPKALTGLEKLGNVRINSSITLRCHGKKTAAYFLYS